MNLVKQGKQVTIVSSGAISFGCEMLNLTANKLKLQEKQYAAVCGQHELISSYKECFAKRKQNIAQVLFTIEDVENRKRFSFIKSTLNFLLENNVIPIVNENDLIANTEIRFGDNDRLSARVAQIVEADLLIMLSLVDGLFTSNPTQGIRNHFVSEVYEVCSDIENMASDSHLKTGGMFAKVASAKIAFNNNCNTIIANGLLLNPIQKIIEGARCTKFITGQDSAQKYKVE